MTNAVLTETIDVTVTDGAVVGHVEWTASRVITPAALTADALAGIKRGIADVKAGRTTPWSDIRGAAGIAR